MELAELEPGLAEQLRAEAHGMAAAYLEALRALCPSGSVVGVYAKGSAYRPWSSVIDYVPELSDVDVHVRLSQSAYDQLRTLPGALDVAEAALATFRAGFPKAIHTPRPQLFVLQDIEKLPGYLPSPAGCVHTLFGAPYEAGTRRDYEGSRTSDRTRFQADAQFIAQDLPGKVIDRPGQLLWRAVATITWRVAPAAPRLLTQLGPDPYDVWSWNRSTVVDALVARGHSAVARAYADFYLAGWAGFRSRFEDAAAARRALTAASRVYTEGRALLEGM